MKNKSKHDWRRTGGKRAISADVKFAGRGSTKIFSIKSFSSCKDLLPEKRDLSNFLPDFHRIMLCNPLRKIVVIFRQVLPIEMKNKSKHDQRRAGGKKGSSRQSEIYGQSGRRRFFPSNHFPHVRIYYQRNAIYQGFRRDWPVEFCANLAPSRRKFLPNLSIDDE